MLNLVLFELYSLRKFDIYWNVCYDRLEPTESFCVSTLREQFSKSYQNRIAPATVA